MSTLLGALAARCAGIPVAHVEAGLRSFRWFHPFPEELTRLAVTRLVSYAYCPGPWAAGNLKGASTRIIDTGDNTLLDAVRWALRVRSGTPDDAAEAPYFVASIHRFENLYRRQRLLRIISILERLASRARCIFILHPVTRSRLEALGLLRRLRDNPRFEIRPRMKYTRFVGLLAGARFVVSDGGSNQEELSYLGIPTVLMRAATERNEGLGSCVFLGNYEPAPIESFLDACPAASISRNRLVSGNRPSAMIVDHLEALLTAA
jgi:UDP-N-acetylglucosamine 2-epimerase (non-hydrolysing)